MKMQVQDSDEGRLEVVIKNVSNELILGFYIGP